MRGDIADNVHVFIDDDMGVTHDAHTTHDARRTTFATSTTSTERIDMARKATSKVCRACGESGRVGRDDPKANAFYRDKSQGDGFSPWCKACERAYNRAYRKGLKDVEATRVRNIDNDDALTTYNNAHVVAGTRVARKRGTTNTHEAKVASKTRTTTRRRARKDKDATTGKDAS